MFQISRHLSVESGPNVSKAGPGSIHVLRPNSVSDFQYRPVLDVRSVGSVPRSNPASTRPESITATSIERRIVVTFLWTRLKWMISLVCFTKFSIISFYLSDSDFSPYQP